MTPILSTIDLGSEQLMAVEACAGERLRVLCGTAWLTQEGEPGDAFLGIGDEICLRGGRTLVQALQPARVQIVGERPALYRLRRLGQRLASWTARLQWGAVLPESLLRA